MALVGGAIADRVDLRRMVVACETVLALQAAALCVLALTASSRRGSCTCSASSRASPSRSTRPRGTRSCSSIVGRDDLTNAVALSSSLGTTARIVGPALGGLVVASVGPGVAFGLNAVSYAIVICALLAMRLAPRPRRTGPLPGVLAGIGEALRFAVGSRRVAVTFCTVLLVSTFSFNFDVLLPLVARLTLDEGARTFGLIASVFGCGALCGALILATVGRTRMLLVLGGAFGFGGFQLLLAPQDTLPAVCALLFLTGICYVLWGSSALATLQLAAPEHLRGRAASLYFFAFMGGAPLGGLIAGSLTAHGGTRLAFAFAGTMALLVVTVGAAVLVMGRRPAAPLQSTQEVEA